MKWTKEDLDYLRNYYSKLDKRVMAEHLGRSVECVRQKAYRLRINSHRYFIDEEIEYIKENYGKKTIKQIAKRLHRPFNSVKSKVSKMGLGRYIDNIDGINVREVGRMLNIKHYKIIYWEKYGLKINKVGKYSIINQDDLADFLEKNPHLWDATECEAYYFEFYPWFHKKLLEDRKKKLDKVV